MSWRNFINLEILRFAQDDVNGVCNDKRLLKKCAFTLSEVLIVLAVLGVVAAMTIPDLIQDYREKAMVTALKKNYAIFSQAVDMAIAENGSPNTWDIGTGATAEDALKVYDILKPYLRIEKECAAKQKGCFANHYAALFNENSQYTDTIRRGPQGILSSGASFTVYSRGTGCPNGSFCAVLNVDLNGIGAPNTAGIDLFEFFIHSDGLLPNGQRAGGQCYYNNTSTTNGIGCGYWVLKQGNMDYRRKDGCYNASCR